MIFYHYVCYETKLNENKTIYIICEKCICERFTFEQVAEEETIQRTPATQWDWLLVTKPCLFTSTSVDGQTIYERVDKL